MKDHVRMAGYLALAGVGAVVLAPPEAFGSGRMLLVVTATFAFLVLSVKGDVPVRYLAGGVAVWILLIIHSIWMSQDFYRSLEFLGLAWAYYCLFGVFRYSPDDSRYRASLVLVATASAVSFYGLYQYLWGFDKLVDFVEASQATDAARAPILGILAGERVFSTFALPGTLWGFLILTIPLHGVLWTSDGRWRQAALVANVLLVVAVSALTQSYGFVLGLLAALAGWALTAPGPQSVRRAVQASLVAVPLAGVVVGALYLARAGTHNPIWLRLQNWLSAWEIFAAHPLGSGLNTYAVLYPQHQQPGANETQFAHNTPLQLTAELGVLGLLAMGLLAVYLLPRLRDLPGITGARRGIVVALLVWGVHNLIDINVYFGSVGAVGAALAGLFLWSPALSPDPAGPLHRSALLGTSLLATLAVVSSGIVYLSGELLVRARTELELGRTAEAAATLDLAARINPFDSSIMHEAGQTALELYHRTRDPGQLDRAQTCFARAIELSPLKVGPHIGLALSLSSEDRIREALREIEIAQTLHPAGAQAGNIRRLLEDRQAELATQGSSRP